MPAYYVEFLSSEGAQRLPFTLDQGRALGPQVRQILEELNQRGVILAGGPGDELSIRWNGRALPETGSPEALGMTPDRPLELRMQRSVRPAAAPTAARRAEPLPSPYVPRGSYASPIAAAAGGLVAWLATAVVAGLPGGFPHYIRLDIAAAALLGGCVVAAIAGDDARRRAGNAAVAMLLGAAFGAGGAAAGAVAAAATAPALAGDGGPAGFVLQRALFWALTGAGVGAAAGARFRPGLRPVLSGAAAGALTGAAAPLLMLLPGPTDLWHATAFMLLGAAVAVGACSLPLRRTSALVELISSHGRPPGFGRLLEWPLRDGETIELRVPGMPRHDAPVALRFEAGRCKALPAAGPGVKAPPLLGGQPVLAPTELLNGDVLQLGPAQYRFRRLRQVDR